MILRFFGSSATKKISSNLNTPVVTKWVPKQTEPPVFNPTEKNELADVPVVKTWEDPHEIISDDFLKKLKYR
ncbi:MAG: hypothetical protein ACD_46C00087G0005 [uncultured bacterium]|nr:MAG: hypothetical protein ACD_46C00087G0005 [uncultured bacterium]